MALPMHLHQTVASMDNKRAALTSRRAKAKFRTLYSCINCRRRKVKCDRVQPCYACCLRGVPDECTYVASGDKRNYMTQADALAALRNEVKALKKKVAEYEQGLQTSDDEVKINATECPPEPRYFALEAIAGALATTCPTTCEEIVDQIRTGTDLSVIATFALAELNPSADQVHPHPWDGSNAKPMVGGAILLDREMETPSSQSSDWMTLTESGGMETEFLHLSIPGLPRHWESFSPFFIDRFIQDFAPPSPWSHRSTASQLDTCWLRTLAHDISSFPFARYSLCCVATAYCGKMTEIPEISLSAQNMYAASLRALQYSLAAGTEPSTDSICNALILWIFELISSSCPLGWMNHLHGVQKLFERRGPHNATSGIEHRAFLFIRFHGIEDAILQRRPNFFSNSEWKTVPFSLNSSGKSPLQCLLDEAADIPELLLMHDNMKEQFNRGHLSQEEKQAMSSRLSTRVDRVIDSLRSWRTQHEGRQPGHQVEMPGVDTCKKTGRTWLNHRGFGFPLPPFPGSRCGSTQPDAVVYYSDGFVAQSMSLYYACIIALCRLRTELLPGSGTSEVYDSACCICRSIEYLLFYVPPGAAVLWIACPLWQAYHAFTDESPEQAWMDGLLTWMDERSPFIMSRLVRHEGDIA